MTTPFTARDARLSGAVDRHFGESATISPMKYNGDVNRRRVPDASREPQTLIGVWSGAPKRMYPKAEGNFGDDMVRERLINATTFDVEEAKLAWRPVRGDRLTRLHDGATYEVGDVYSDDFERLFMNLTARKP